jgi:hypothetical protein
MEKNPQHEFFQRGSKAFGPTSKNLRHDKNLTGMKGAGKIHGHFWLTSISASDFQRALVDESGMIRTQMRSHNISEIFAVLGTPCVVSSSNSNITLLFT